MYLNYQKYSECQLVTAVNASTFFGFPPIEIGSNEYERLVDLVCARHGSAMSIERANEYLKIKKKPIKFENITWKNTIEKLDEGHPLEFSVWHKSTGLHSVLVTDYKIDRRTSSKNGRLSSTKRVKVLNLRKVTDKDCYMNWNKFKNLVKDYSNPNMIPCYYFYINPLFRDTRFLKIKHKEKNEN